jgi:hypothetical protein
MKYNFGKDTAAILLFYEAEKAPGMFTAFLSCLFIDELSAENTG